MEYAPDFSGRSRLPSGLPSALLLALLLHTILLLSFTVELQPAARQPLRLKLASRDHAAAAQPSTEPVQETSPEPLPATTQPEESPPVSAAEISSASDNKVEPRLQQDWREEFRKQLAAPDVSTDFSTPQPLQKNSFFRSNHAPENTALIQAVEHVGQRTYVCGRTVTIDLGIKVVEMPASGTCSKQAFEAQFRQVVDNQAVDNQVGDDEKPDRPW